MLAFYLDRECTTPLENNLWKDYGVEYLTKEMDVEVISNVVSLKETSETELYVRNEGENTVAIYDIQHDFSDLKIELLDDGLLKPMETMGLKLSITPKNTKEPISINLNFLYNVIYGDIRFDRK